MKEGRGVKMRDNEKLIQMLETFKQWFIRRSLWARLFYFSLVMIVVFFFINNSFFLDFFIIIVIISVLVQCGKFFKSIWTTLNPLSMLLFLCIVMHFGFMLILPLMFGRISSILGIQKNPYDYFFDFAIYLDIFVFIPIILLIRDLVVLFSESIYDGVPKKPSTYSTFNLFIPGFILKRIFPSAVPRSIKYATAGRIFTYFSFSTALYLLFVFLFSSELSKILEEKLSLELSTDLGIVTDIIFFLILAIIFFVLKDSFFQYYGRKLILLKSENFENQKKKLISQICMRLDVIANGEFTYVDSLEKEVKLLEKRIAYIDQEIEKIEKEFEFHRSLRLNIVISPISIPISAMLAEIAKLMIGKFLP